MNRGIFEGTQGRFAVLGHANVVADPGGVSLPELPNEGRLRRIVLRASGPITFKLDGSDPTEEDAMYMLEDEIVVLDCDGTGVRIAGAGVNVKILYLGT